MELTVPLSGGSQDRPGTSGVVSKVTVDRVEVTGPSALDGQTESPEAVSVKKTYRPSVYGVTPRTASVSSGAPSTPSAAGVSTHTSRGTGRCGLVEPKSGAAHHDVNFVRELRCPARGLAMERRATCEAQRINTCLGLDLVVHLRHGQSQPYQALRVAPRLGLTSRSHRLALPSDAMYQSPG